MTDSGPLRLGVIGVVILSLFSALFARLWYLQVLDSESFVTAAEQNQVRVVYEEAPRGRILDRQGRVLVDNRISEVVTVDRSKIADREDVVVRLAALIGLSPAELQERIEDPRYGGQGPVPVLEDAPEELVVHLREHQDLFPGVESREVALRTYPHGTLGAHVLGYVGEVNDAELDERRGLGYQPGDTIGKVGVERAYESDLRGEPAITKLEVDSRGRVLRTLGRKEAVQGADVQLTIDLDVQRAAEESLAKGLEAARRGVDREEGKPFVAPAGAVVVLDPRDGGVVAMASYPTFDPGEIGGGISRERFAQLQDPAGHYPLNNRALQGQYAPGSTFKIVTALAGLERGLITPATTIADGGVYRVPRCRGEKCTFRNAGSRAYGKVALARSLTVSSDVYYYDLGARFWQQRGEHGDAIQEVARRFGLGEKLGIELPGEMRGRIPDPEMRRRMHEQNPRAFPEGAWRTGDNINMSIGQGEVAVTPLQLASLYATFANGGTLHRPHLASRIVGQDGSVRREIVVEELRKIHIDPAARSAMIAGLRGVTTSGEGTAAAAFAPFPTSQIPVAAKTGTAQVSRKQDTALFAAFAPAVAPEYAVAVVMEEAGFGGSTAAPVARRTLEAAFGRDPAGELHLAESTE